MQRNAIDWTRLADFFPAEDIEWKPLTISKKTNKGLAAAYITARAIQERLDEVFGVGGWKNEYRPGPEGGVICRIYFKNEEGEWVWREDGAENTDVEAVKGGLSGAMKRAGSALGIGRYLYRLPQQWVPVDERGRFAKTPTVPAAFLPPVASPSAPQQPQHEPARPKQSQYAQSAQPPQPAQHPQRRRLAPRPEVPPRDAPPRDAPPPRNGAPARDGAPNDDSLFMPQDLPF